MINLMDNVIFRFILNPENGPELKSENIKILPHLI